MSTSITDFTPAEIAAAGGHSILLKHGDYTPALQAGWKLGSGPAACVTPGLVPSQVFGTSPGTGALAAAHGGTVVLDDPAEIDRGILDGIRSAHDAGLLHRNNAGTSTTTPAEFRIVIALRGGRTRGISGPLMDRVDIFTEAAEEGTADRLTLTEAASAAAKRLAPYGIKTNAAAPMKLLVEELRAPAEVTAEADRALDRAKISLRGYVRALRLAWTLADLTGHTTPTAEHITAALTHRTP